MAESNKEIVEEMKKINLEEQKLTEDDWFVEDKYMIDCLNMLDDQETGIEKIAKVSCQFLLANAIKTLKKFWKNVRPTERSFLMKKKERKKWVN